MQEYLQIANAALRGPIGAMIRETIGKGMYNARLNNEAEADIEVSASKIQVKIQVKGPSAMVNQTVQGVIQSIQRTADLEETVEMLTEMVAVSTSTNPFTGGSPTSSGGGSIIDFLNGLISDDDAGIGGLFGDNDDNADNCPCPACTARRAAQRKSAFSVGGFGGR